MICSRPRTFQVQKKNNGHFAYRWHTRCSAFWASYCIYNFTSSGGYAAVSILPVRWEVYAGAPAGGYAAVSGHARW